MSLGISEFFVVDSQMPLPIFAVAVGVDKLVFFLRGGPVLAPFVSLVYHDFSFADELFGVLECSPVQFRCHTYLLSSAVARAQLLGDECSLTSRYIALWFRILTLV
jgi:hypothetical protein